MPSVFTIKGPDLGNSGRRCKLVRNGKTGCTIKLCYVGKSKRHPTGWSFMKGSSSCSR